MVNIPYIDNVDRTKKVTPETKFRTTEIEGVKVNLKNILGTQEKEIPVLKELTYNSLKELETILKNDFDLIIDIEKILDDKTGEVLAEIFKLKETKTFSLVGEIFKSKYKDKNFIGEDHLYNVVEKWAKGKGYGKLMFSLYLEYAKLSDNNLIIPKEEYTNIASMINLYEKFGYKAKYKINGEKNTKKPLTKEDKKLIKKEILSYKKGNTEQKLTFSVILEKV